MDGQTTLGERLLSWFSCHSECRVLSPVQEVLWLDKGTPSSLPDSSAPASAVLASGVVFP